MKLRWIFLLAGAVALLAILIYRVSWPYLYGTPSSPPSIQEFRSGTFRSTSTTEPTP